VFFYHEEAFVRPAAVIAELRRAYARRCGGELICLKVPARRVPLATAVKSYLFNSQLVTLAPGRMALIAPAECREIPAVRRYLDDLLARGHTPIGEVRFFDLRQSMRNGGGPACLRLRVVLTDVERAALPSGVFIGARSHAALTTWVKKHYRESLRTADLADPQLLEESRRALDELTQLLGLGSIYPFQQI
jgi:succinylarginine dihydrolase